MRSTTRFNLSLITIALAYREALLQQVVEQGNARHALECTIAELREENRRLQHSVDSVNAAQWGYTQAAMQERAAFEEEIDGLNEVIADGTMHQLTLLGKIDSLEAELSYYRAGNVVLDEHEVLDLADDQAIELVLTPKGWAMADDLSFEAHVNDAFANVAEFETIPVVLGIMADGKPRFRHPSKVLTVCWHPSGQYRLIWGPDETRDVDIANRDETLCVLSFLDLDDVDFEGAQAETLKTITERSAGQNDWLPNEIVARRIVLQG